MGALNLLPTTSRINLIPRSTGQRSLFEDLDMLLPYTREGKLKWAGLTEQVEICKSRYGEKPTLFRKPFRRPTGARGKVRTKPPPKPAVPRSRSASGP